MIHPINTPIYYTGDRANQSGYGRIIDTTNNLYKILITDTNQLFYITDQELSTQPEHHTKRFYTKDEYEQDRQNKIDKFNNLIN